MKYAAWNHLAGLCLTRTDAQVAPFLSPRTAGVNSVEEDSQRRHKMHIGLRRLVISVAAVAVLSAGGQVRALNKHAFPWVGPTALQDNYKNAASSSWRRGDHPFEIFVAFRNGYSLPARIKVKVTIFDDTHGAKESHSMEAFLIAPHAERESASDWFNVETCHDGKSNSEQHWRETKIRVVVELVSLSLKEQPTDELYTGVFPTNHLGERQPAKQPDQPAQPDAPVANKQPDTEKPRQDQLVQQQEAQRQRDEQQRKQDELRRQREQAAAQQLQNQQAAQQATQAGLDIANQVFSDKLEAIGQATEDRVASLRSQFDALPPPANAEVSGLRQQLLDKLIEAENEDAEAKRAAANRDAALDNGDAMSKSDKSGVSALIGLIAGAKQDSRADDHAMKANVARQEADRLRGKLRDAERRAVARPTADGAVDAAAQARLVQNLKFELFDVVKSYAESIANDATQSDAKVGAAAMMLQDYASASAAFAKWLEANPNEDKYEPLHALAIVLNGEPGRGLDMLSKLRGSSHLGTAQTASDILAKLEEKGLQRQTPRATQYADQGRVYAAAAAWADSEQAYRKAVVADPLEPRWRRELAGALAKQKVWDAAIQEYKEAVRLDRTDSRTLANLGACLLQAKEWNDAVEAYGRAVELEPASAAYNDNLGTAYWCAGNLAKAVDAYTEAARLDPAETKYQDHLNKAQEAKAKQ